MPLLNAAPLFTRVAVDSIQFVMLTLRATARSVGEAIAAKLGWVWGQRSARVGASTTVQVEIVETVAWVEKPSTSVCGKRWVSCVNSAYVPLRIRRRVCARARTVCATLTGKLERASRGAHFGAHPTLLVASNGWVDRSGEESLKNRATGASQIRHFLNCNEKGAGAR
jgi:hypothetical protein